MRRSARFNLNGDAGPAGAAIHTFLSRRPSREEAAWGPGTGQLQPREGEGGRAPPRGSRSSGVCGQRSRATAGRAPGRGAHHPPGPHSPPSQPLHLWLQPRGRGPHGRPPVAVPPWLPPLPLSVGLTSQSNSWNKNLALCQWPGIRGTLMGRSGASAWSEYRLRSQTWWN